MRMLMTGLIGLAALSLGCSAGQSSRSGPTPQSGPGETGPGGRRQARVEIDNRNFNDMNIYLIDAGTRVHIGSANGLSRTTLLIPRAASLRSSRVMLLADPIGSSSSVTSPDLIVGPGQNVYWTIGSSPANSFASAS